MFIPVYGTGRSNKSQQLLHLILCNVTYKFINNECLGPFKAGFLEIICQGVILQSAIRNNNRLVTEAFSANFS